MSMSVHNCMLMHLNTYLNQEKIKSEDKYFLTYLSSKVYIFFKIPSLCLKTQLPWYFSLLTKKVGIRACLTEVEME